MKTLSWRKDLKLNAARCFSGTHASVRFTRETFVDNRLPREACFDLGDVKVEMKRRMKTFSWRKDLYLNATPCFSGTHATVRFTEETFVTSGSRVKRVLTRAMSTWRRMKTLSWRKDLGLSMKRRMKTLSWRKDLKLNAARCFSGTHATVRFCKATVVTSGSRVKFAFDQDDVKMEKYNVTFNEEGDEAVLVEEGSD